MRLKEIKYIEPGFSIDGLYFDYVSLIVAKNAVGKSRVVSVVFKLFQILMQRYELKENDYFEYDVVFADDGTDLHYRFVCQSGEVFYEYLSDSYNHYIDRKDGVTNFYGSEIYPPKNKLSVNIHRDVVKYPEVEKIIHWAEQSYGLLFSRINLQHNYFSSYSIMSGTGSIVSMFEKLDTAQRKNVVSEMNTLGYQLESISVEEINPSYKLLKLNEKDVLSVVWQHELSHGMQQALYIIVFLNYLTTEAVKANTVIIDDFCQGLDFDKSIAMGKLVYDFCIRKRIQLITTTNNNFLMDNVNLNYWNILQREGGKVTSLNMHNSRQMFLDFKEKQLNNFQLFATDFIKNHKK